MRRRSEPAALEPRAQTEPEEPATDQPQKRRQRLRMPSASQLVSVHGLFVNFAKIDSFIATLGVGTALYGFSNWYTNGQQIVGHLAAPFLALNGTSVLGIPAPAIYVAVIAVILWISFEFLPVGRYL